MNTVSDMVGLVMKSVVVNLTDAEIDEILSCIGVADNEYGSSDLTIALYTKLTAAKAAVWQSEPPTEDGAYWWWEHSTHAPRIVHIVKTPDPTTRAVQAGEWVLFYLPKWNRGQWWPIPIVMPPI